MKFDVSDRHSTHCELDSATIVRFLALGSHAFCLLDDFGDPPCLVRNMSLLNGSMTLTVRCVQARI